MDLTELQWRFTLGQPAPAHKPPGVPSTLRDAAVLLAFQQGPKGAELLFIQRPMHLKVHPGQVAFPGGKWETTDVDLVDTALREAQEEIGLSRQQLQLLGTLPIHQTVTGFSITPVVGVLHSQFQPQLSCDEVSALFPVPMEYLLRPSNRHELRLLRRQQPHTVSFFPFQERLIWGATAAIVDNLLALISGTHTKKRR